MAHTSKPELRTRSAKLIMETKHIHKSRAESEQGESLPESKSLDSDCVGDSMSMIKISIFVMQFLFLDVLGCSCSFCGADLSKRRRPVHLDV